MPCDTVSSHPLQPLWSLSLQSLQADALDAALSLGLLRDLREPHTPDALAARLSLQAEPLALLLELLWAMQVLERLPLEGGGCAYRLHAALSGYLVIDSPDYCGDSLQFRLQSMRAFGASLADRLRGTAASAPSLPGDWATAAQAQLWQEQGCATAPAARQAIAQLDGLDGPRRFLDLGGGPGRVAIALAQQWPQWQGAVFDLPDTARVAQHAISQAGLSQRLQARGGNMDTDDLGQGYDLIWCSSVLHFCRDVPAMLARLTDSLAPGGWLVAAHAEIPVDRDMAARVLPYYLPLRMRGQTMWHSGALAAMLADAGLKDIRQRWSTEFALAPVRLVVARKEAA